jgi:hypothetical protein
MEKNPQDTRQVTERLDELKAILNRLREYL